MSGDEDFSKDDNDDVIGKLLDDLGVDEETRKDLVDSGRISSDVFKVATADQIRRRMEIEKSTKRLRESLNLVERNILEIDTAIDRIERDLIPVILSFLVGLKGNLVALRTDVIGRSKRRAKTNLQSTYVETEVKSIVDEEFAKIEHTLTSDMATPILDKVREVADTFKETLRHSLEELATLKGTIEDFTQRTNTEVEFLTKEISMKPKVEVPKEVQEELDQLKRRVQQLMKEVELAEEKIQNRENEIAALQKNLSATKERNASLEASIQTLKATPSIDAEAMAELRQTIKSLEAKKELIERKLSETEERLAESESEKSDVRDKLTRKELECEELRGNVSSLESDLGVSSERILEIDELRSRVKQLESGDTMRELERTKSELERARASLERATNDMNAAIQSANYNQSRIDAYLGLMGATEKTKAFLMLEENQEMTIREIARSLGVSDAVVKKWTEDYVSLGIAKVVDDAKLVLSTKPPESK